MSALSRAARGRHQRVRDTNFGVGPRRVVRRRVDNSTTADRHPNFGQLLTHLGYNSRLVIAGLSHLNYGTVSVEGAIRRLARANVEIRYLTLKNVSLADPAKGVVVRMVSTITRFRQSLLLRHARSKVMETHNTKGHFNQPPILGRRRGRIMFRQVGSNMDVDTVTQRFGASQRAVLETGTGLRAPSVWGVVSI